MQNGPATLEKHLAVILKTTTQPFECILRHFPRAIKTCIYSIFIYSSQKLETTQMSSSSWTANQTLVCPCPRALFGSENEPVMDTCNSLHGRVSRESSWGEEASPKRLYTVWLQLPNILEMSKV